MGSLETGIPLKRNNLFRSFSSVRTERHPFSQRPRSRFSRFLLFKKLDYLQWICTVAVFLFFVVLFQMFLPGSVEKSGNSSLQDNVEVSSGDFKFLKEMGVLDFGEDIRFEPSKLLDKFQREATEAILYSPAFNRTKQRFPYRKPQLAMVSIQLLSELFVGSYIFVCLINGIVWFHVYFLCSEINYFWRILCFFGVRDCFFFLLHFLLEGFCRSVG